MRAVKAAEKKLWEVEKTKTYTGLAGEPAYNAAMVQMILGDGFADRAASVATPGGTGAIRQALELIRMANPHGKGLDVAARPGRTIRQIVKYLGMPMAEYRYFDAATARHRFCRADGGSGRRGRGRCRAAAWLLPQPDRGQPGSQASGIR